MGMQNSAEFFKEQLRLKNLELKKRDAEKVKIQEKVKHILALNEQKIVELKHEIEKKAEARHFDTMMPPSNLGPATVEVREVVTEVIKEVVVPDPKLAQAVAELKAKNSELAGQINAASGERDKVVRERELLVKEIRRLRDNPESTDKLKAKILQLETRFKELQTRNENLLRERGPSSFPGGGPESPQETVIFAAGTPEQLQQDFVKLKKENQELAEKLEIETKKFEAKLNKEIEKLKTELEEKSQKIRRGRREGNLAEEHVGGAAGVHAPFWMITFADMSALLLAFFIVLYTMVADNISKVRSALTGDETGGVGMLDFLDSIDMKEKLKAFSVPKSKDILTEVNKAVQSKDLESQVSVSTDEGKIILRVPGNTLFLPGKADLQKEARPILDGLIKTTKDYPKYKINIQGHTDDVPIESPLYPTNWELSAARATAVLRYFLDKGIEPTRLTATGFADIFPIASNDTEAGRAQNRRVELVLEKEK